MDDKELDLVKRIERTTEQYAHINKTEMEALDRIDEALRMADEALERRVTEILHEHAKRRLRVANTIAELHRRVGILPIPGPEPRDPGVKIYSEPVSDDAEEPMPRLLSVAPARPTSLKAALDGIRSKEGTND
jgi:hypothetical protein